MDPASANSNSIDPSFILSHQQEELLHAALNSNNPNTKKAAAVNHSPQSQNRSSMAPSAFTESPLDGAAPSPSAVLRRAPSLTTTTSSIRGANSILSPPMTPSR